MFEEERYREEFSQVDGQGQRKRKAWGEAYSDLNSTLAYLKCQRETELTRQPDWSLIQYEIK